MSENNNSPQGTRLRSALPEALSGCRAVEVLERSLAQNRLGHGILLHGESLASLESIVRAIAAYLLKTQRDPFEHPDCFILRPGGKARLIKVGKSEEANSMRKLVVDIAKSSNQGGRKVGVVVDADRMNAASANAFLKTLEEPPPGTTLFLLTTRPYDLLDTIRSRCLNFRIPAELETIQHPDWEKWVVDYREWMGRLLNGPNKQTVPHIMMGAVIHLRIIRGFAFGPIFGRVDMGAGPGSAFHQSRVDDRGLGLLELQPMRLDLTANLSQKIVVNTTFHQGVAKATMGRLIRYGSMQIEPAKDHEIQPNLQRPLQLGVAQTVPLSNQQALEQDQWIITLGADTGTSKTAFENGRKRRPIHQRINLGQGIIDPNPIHRFTQK